MLKKIFKILRRIVVAGFILYGYNLMASPLDLMIPINVITVVVICLFGIPAIPFLALLLIVVFK